MCMYLLNKDAKQVLLKKDEKKPKILMQLLPQGSKALQVPNITQIDNALNRHLSKTVRKLFTYLVYKCLIYKSSFK